MTRKELIQKMEVLLDAYENEHPNDVECRVAFHGNENGDMLDLGIYCDVYGWSGAEIVLDYEMFYGDPFATSKLVEKE